MRPIGHDAVGDLGEAHGAVHRVRIERAEIFDELPEQRVEMIWWRHSRTGQSELAEEARQIRLGCMALSRMAACLGALLGAAGALQAQQRRTLVAGEPESQLMGYYAAVMQFTPVGLPSRDGRLELGGAISKIPTVSFEDRLVGFGGTKVENTNLCSAFPRLTASKGFGRTTIEVGYTPPVEVCGVKANVMAFALGRRMTLGATWEGYARISALTGRVDATVTCSAADTANATNQTCYEGTPSSDRIAPFAISIDFAAAWQGWQRHHMEPYFLAGIRHEAVNFDVNYERIGKSYPDLIDHNRLRASLSRIHLGAGIAWQIARPVRLGAELYYAPGAMMTLRARGALVL